MTPPRQKLFSSRESERAKMCWRGLLEKSHVAAKWETPHAFFCHGDWRATSSRKSITFFFGHPGHTLVEQHRLVSLQSLITNRHYTIYFRLITGSLKIHRQDVDPSSSSAKALSLPSSPTTEELDEALHSQISHGSYWISPIIRFIDETWHR